MPPLLDVPEREGASRTCGRRHRSFRGQSSNARKRSGTNERIRALLEGDRFDCVGGPRNSILWSVTNDRVGASDAVTDAVGGNPA